MKIHIDCIPCYFRQALQASKFATGDPTLWWDTLRNVAAYVGTLGPDTESHEAAENVHRVIRESTRCDDPYKDVKREFNVRALGMLDEARRRMEAAAGPLEAAARIAIAGNVIDFGSAAFLDLDTAMARALDTPFAIDHSAAFLETAGRARTVLLLADNTGEIVFDRLLLEQLAPRRLIVAVRGAPILNDATPTDAEEAGIPALAEIIHSGLPVPGIPLDRVPREFLDIFHAADIIIAKGQANFESLSGLSMPNLFFLFTIKCRLVARRTGTKVGDIVLAQSGAFRILPD